jgi:hypothetical protein
MFCPKCSQQQVSYETRFCSRCGFQLSVVKALLVNDDETQINPQANSSDHSLRKRDLTIGAFVMFFFALVVAIITVDMPSSHSARIIGLIVAWMALSLLINIVPVIRYFLNGNTSGQDNTFSPQIISNITSKIRNKGQTPILPDAHSIPAADYVTGRINTAEMVHPSSITEQTTNLLRND